MTGTSTVQDVLALLAHGRLEPAEAALRSMLHAEPENAAARQLLGAVLLERDQPLQALEQLDHALAINPQSPTLHYNRGNALSALRRLEEAASSYEAATRLRPEMSEAHFNRGNALRALGLQGSALAAFRQAAVINPALFQAHNNAGSLLHELGRLPEALASFDAALAARSDHAGAHHNRGLVLRDLGQLDAALASFEAAIRLDPGLAEAIMNRAGVLRRRGRLEDSIAGFERAIALLPGNADAFNERGVALHESGRIAAAMVSYEHAISLRPEMHEAWNNLGNAQHDLRRFDKALASYERAIALRPDFAEAINNRGMVRQDLRQLEQAEADYDRAIRVRPNYAEAFNRRASLKLLGGRFAEGWADYETGLAHARARLPAQGIRQWQGEPLAGKSILLSEPNGLGDTLQFFRFVPRLIAQGARVSFLGPPRFFRILAAFSDRVRFVTSAEDNAYDFQCWLWSLPHYLGIGADVGAHMPYLCAEPALVTKWAHLLEPERLNVGICWQGNPLRKIDRSRSIPLADFLPVAQVADVRLISLQKNFGLEQLGSLPQGMQVVSPGPDFDAGPDAFVDSAALVQGLDLVITADTSITHLAGALGRPVWLALNPVPDWRWMLDRGDSPWYPSARLFRQQRDGDWTSVFGVMADSLRQARPAHGREPGPAG